MLEDLVEKKYLEDFRQNRHKYFEDPTSRLHQGGKLKLDYLGTKSLFYAVKAYLIVDETSSGELRRFKGCSRLVQNSLPQESFEVVEEQPLLYSNRHKLMPTQGFQMVMKHETRKIVTSVSLKRRFDVSVSSTSICRAVLSNFIPIFFFRLYRIQLLCNMPDPLIPNPKLETFFNNSLKKGELVTLSSLKRFAKKERIKVDTGTLRRLRRRFKFALMFSKTRQKNPRHMAAAQIPSHGMVFIDHASIFPSYAIQNRQRKGIIIACEYLSNCIYAVPVTSRSKENWYKAVREIIEESPISGIRTFICDKEGAVFSPHFQTRIQNEYGISFEFPTTNSKAYLAECFIRHVREAISKSIKARKKDGDKNYRTWITVLPTILSSFNNKKIAHTRFRRKDVDKSNMLEFLDELHKMKDSTMSFNMGNISGRSIRHTRWKNAVFKFPIGSKVLVNRRKLPGGGSKVFNKPSRDGGYDPEVFVIAEQRLKRGNHLYLVPGKAKHNSSLFQPPTRFYFFFFSL